MNEQIEARGRPVAIAQYCEKNERLTPRAYKARATTERGTLMFIFDDHEKAQVKSGTMSYN